MGSESLVEPEELAAGLESGRCLAVDCRFELSAPQRGHELYLGGHVPGAHYAHLDHDLSAPVTATSGRHPLPSADAFAAFLSRIGWDRDRLLVAYDERSNAIAARLWWLMRYFGQRAALLNGGLEAWQHAGLPLERDEPVAQHSEPPRLEPDPERIVSADRILDAGERLTLIDARAAERYRGEIEPLDARGGHIPGAVNRPMGRNVDASGRFKSAARLRTEFEALVGAADPGDLVNYCGSGVTACHNQFALERAGYPGARVYPGSWSEWLRDPERPIATGRE